MYQKRVLLMRANLSPQVNPSSVQGLQMQQSGHASVS
jgi:hypothetical protein